MVTALPTRSPAPRAAIPDHGSRVSCWLGLGDAHGLYVRALFIIIMPMVIPQSVVAFMFVERALEYVYDGALSAAVTRRTSLP